MVEYLKTNKGYYYKKFKNGEKKRISQDEYNKKTKLKTIMKGGARKLDIDFGIVTHQTIGDCIKELIEESYNIYTRLLSSTTKLPITIICGGQSPSYYCLAMMNFKVFNPDLVNIVILPHSKGGQKTYNYHDQYNEDINYCERLKEKKIHLNKNIVIIDGVHSGTGILALESALTYCFSSINIYKIAINAAKDISEIPVDEEIILPCEPKFSDQFPRLVTSFKPKDFGNSSKFITSFINLDTNPIAEMIIDIAKNYPNISVEDTEWFKLNNDITPEIAEKKRIYQIETTNLKLQEESKQKLKEGKPLYYKPIILTNPKRYQCPICNFTSGTAAPLNPKDLSLFQHRYNCPNKFKIPQE
jgi:hypothetical protein